MDSPKPISKYFLEFLTIFIGVLAAFGLDNWNQSRRDKATEIHILTEIKTGLSQDLEDIDGNARGHQWGLSAVNYFRDVLLEKPVATDSAAYHYFNLLRSFVAVQNVAGYETLKSKGLDIIRNDSLRTGILTLYENDYSAIRKIEESYPETQYQVAYFQEFNTAFAPNFIIDTTGNIKGLKLPLALTPKEKNILLVNLWKITLNRRFLLSYYGVVKENIHKLQERIDRDLGH